MIDNILDGVACVASLLFLISAAFVDSSNPWIFVLICLFCGGYLAFYGYYTEGNAWN